MEKEQIIKDMESFLAKLKEKDKPKIDFSILNDTDVFYLKCKYNFFFEWDFLFIGNPFDIVKGYNIKVEAIFTNKVCTKDVVIELRKATDEEIALYRQHYPVKQKVWIEIFKDSYNDIHVILYKTKKELENGLEKSIYFDYKTLEVIEKEY